MKKKLTEKTIYEPNEGIKITVENKPADDQDALLKYQTKVTIKIDVGYRKDKLLFATDDDISQFIETVNFEDPQQSLLGDK